ESASSMNSEIVARLERSISADDELGDGPTRALLRDIARQIALVEAKTGRRWNSDPVTYWAARSMTLDAFNRAKPTPANYDEINQLEAERARLESQRSIMTGFLIRCEAIGLSQNALASLASLLS